jgi:hypothetical protein
MFRPLSIFYYSDPGLHTNYFHTTSHLIEHYLFCGQPSGGSQGEATFTLG